MFFILKKYFELFLFERIKLFLFKSLFELFSLFTLLSDFSSLICNPFLFSLILCLLKLDKNVSIFALN